MWTSIPHYIVNVGQEFIILHPYKLSHLAQVISHYSLDPEEVESHVVGGRVNSGHQNVDSACRGRVRVAHDLAETHALAPGEYIQEQSAASANNKKRPVLKSCSWLGLIKSRN